MTIHPGLPRLHPNNHQVTSPATTDYNCIAFAAGDTAHWWEPGRYWPTQVNQSEYGREVLTQAFVVLGFIDCSRDEEMEPGYEKVALYASGDLYNARRPATSFRQMDQQARQLD